MKPRIVAHGEFQFQTGSIRSEALGLEDELENWSFNSKLVRLEEHDADWNQPAYNSFNSKLVRLEGSLMAHVRRFCQVSIPHWFD